MLRPRIQLRERALRCRRLDPAGAGGVAADGVAADKLKHQVRCRGDGCHQARAQVRSKHLFERVRIMLDARDHLTAVQTRRTLAHVHGVHYQHLTAGERQVQRRRESRIAGADDDRLRTPRGAECAERGPGGRRRGPQGLQRHGRASGASIDYHRAICETPCAMRSAFLKSVVMLGVALSARALGAPAVPPPLPAEHLTVEQLPAKTPHWVYVFDEAFINEIDSRLHLFDGDTYRRLGQIDAGFGGSVNESPDGATTVVATTYFARGSRGTRTDVVEFTDNATLAPTHEIVLPPKRAMTVPNLFNVGYSADGHFVYVAYVTPADLLRRPRSGARQRCSTRSTRPAACW